MRYILLVAIVFMLCLVSLIVFKNNKIRSYNFPETSRESVKDTSVHTVYWIPVKKEFSEDFLNLADSMLKKTSKEPGILFYSLIYSDKTETDTVEFFLYENFKNNEAVDFHLNSEHFKAFKDSTANMVYKSIESCIKEKW